MRRHRLLAALESNIGISLVIADDDQDVRLARGDLSRVGCPCCKGNDGDGLPPGSRALHLGFHRSSYLIPMSSGFSVDALMAWMVSRTHLAFMIIKFLGKFFSSFSK